MMPFDIKHTVRQPLAAAYNSLAATGRSLHKSLKIRCFELVNAVLHDASICILTKILK